MLLLVLVGFVVSLYMLQVGGVETPKNRPMEEFCGLSSVPVNPNKKFVLVANSDSWGEGEECIVTIHSILNEKIFVVFSAYDVTDCGVKVKLYWGNKHGQKEFTCKKKPELFKGYQHGNDSNLTITITGAENRKGRFSFTYAISSNKNSLPMSGPVTTITTPSSRANCVTSPSLFIYLLASTVIFVVSTFIRHI